MLKCQRKIQDQRGPWHDNSSHNRSGQFWRVNGRKGKGNGVLCDVGFGMFRTHKCSCFRKLIPKRWGERWLYVGCNVQCTYFSSLTFQAWNHGFRNLTPSPWKLSQVLSGLMKPSESQLSQKKLHIKNLRPVAGPKKRLITYKNTITRIVTLKTCVKGLIVCE